MHHELYIFSWERRKQPHRSGNLPLALARLGWNTFHILHTVSHQTALVRTVSLGGVFQLSLTLSASGLEKGLLLSSKEHS